MTATTLNKYKTILYDEKGKPVMAQLDLRNRLMRKFFEKAMEAMEDYIDTQEAMERTDDGSERRPFSEFVDEFNAEKPAA